MPLTPTTPTTSVYNVSSANLTKPRTLEPYLGDITTTGAAIIVNSVGSYADFRNPLARAILKAGGPEIETYVSRHRPIPEGTVIVTPAGNMEETYYIFHAVVTTMETGQPAKLALIEKTTKICITMANLLNMRSIAVPAFGSGWGGAKAEDVVRKMLSAALDAMRDCDTLERVVLATIDPKIFSQYHNHIVLQLVLDERAKEIKALLTKLPPNLYGLVGALLQEMDRLKEAAAEEPDIGNLTQQADALKQHAVQLQRVAKELAEALPEDSGLGATAIQLVIATGSAAVNNITFSTIAQQGGVAAGPGGVAVRGGVHGNIHHF